MTATISPSTEDLTQILRSRTTEQLIADHAVADAATGGDNTDVVAFVLLCSTIETVLNERGVATCPGCGTSSASHADFCGV